MKKITFGIMKSHKKYTFSIYLMFLLMGQIAFAQFPDPYCEVSFPSGVEPITLVQFGEINNTSTNETSDAEDGFELEDYTELSATITPTLSYEITLKGNTAGSFTNYFRVYIDWNQNGDFSDEGELYNIGTIYGSTGLDDDSATATITVPLNALQGTTRMRITKKFNANAGACNTTGFGQAEDYTIIVTDVPSCLSPINVESNNITAFTAVIEWEEQDSEVAGYDYYYSTDNTVPNEETIPSGYVEDGTSAELSGLSSDTEYYVWVRGNCGEGDVSIWSAIESFTTLESCFAPSDIEGTVLQQSFAVSWTAPDEVPANGYEYFYSTENTAPDAETIPSGNTEDTSVTINDLEPNTTYYIWVRGNCGEGDVSVWSDSENFTTDCLPLTLPTAIEDFSSFTGAMPSPDCWKEAKGTLGTDPISLNVGTSTWTNLNFNNSSAHPNQRAAFINLYGSDAEWIISPAIDLGDGSVNYQLEFDALVTPWTGTAAVTAMAEKFVKIVVSTDGGDTWSEANVIQTYDNNNIPAQMVSEAIQLAGYTGVVKIGFYAYSNTNTPDLRFYIDNWQVSETPACISPSDVEVADIDVNSIVINWTASESSPANGYEYYYSEVNTAPTESTTASGSVTAGEISASVSGLTAATQYFVWVRSNCADGYSEWVPATSFYTLCDAPEILTTDASDICGQGTATLSATTSAGDIKWYATETSSTVLAAGAEYETELLTETTSYWVQASTSSLDNNSGKAAPPSSATGTTLTNWGIVFNAEADVELKSVSVYSTSAGTVDIKIMNESMTTELYSTGNVTIENGGTETPNVIPLNFTLESGNGYRMVVKSSSGVNLIRENSGVTFPYNGSDDKLNVVASEWGGITTSNYYYFYDIVYTTLCSSEREEVVVTVTDAPEITVSDDATICAGENAEISVSSDNEDYTYNWMPGNLDGATQTVTPEETTTYIVTATDAVSGCVTISEVTVNVNAVPVANIDTDVIEICEGTVEPLTVNGALVTGDAVIGTGTTAPSTTSYPNPLSAYYGGAKTQILFRADELEAQGLVSGATINSLSFDLFASTANTCNDLTIRLGSTAEEELADGFVSSTGFTTVYNNDYTPVTGTTGLVPFSFTTPFVWNGDNIIVEIVHNQGNNGNGSGTRTRTTTTSFNSVYYGAADGITPAGAASIDALDLEDFDTDNTSTLRPNIVFNYEIVNTAVWSPVEGLYTDSEGTVAYNGEDLATVYIKPTVATTYTVTVSNDAGCFDTATVDVTINIVDAPTIENTEITFCNAGTVADLQATGDNIQWYADETGGEALAEDTSLTEGTYYASQTVDGCESSARTAVTVSINVVEAPIAEAQQSFCNSATVADLMSEDENAVWYNASEDGSILADDTELENGAMYYAATIDGDCESMLRTEVTVTINVIAAPTGDAVQQIAVDNIEDATIEDLTVETEDGAVVSWYASEEDFEVVNALPEGTVVVSGETYYAAQTVGECTSQELFAVTVDVVLGKENFDINAFSYYPNPVNDVLNLAYSQDITSVTVFNLLGQQVVSMQPNATEVRIDMSKLAEGGYIINIQSGNTFKSVKVLKKK